MPCPQPDDPAPVTAVGPAESTTAVTTTCIRCKTNAATAIFRDAVYCQPCAMFVFDSKAKAGLEFARGAGLAKYVEAQQSQSVSISSLSTTPNQPRGVDANVAASIGIAFSGGINSRVLLRTARQYFRPQPSDLGRAARLVGRKDRKPALGSSDATSSNSNNVGRFSEVAKIVVFFIDDSAVIPNAVDRTEEARILVENEGCDVIEFVPLKLEDVYRTSSSSTQGLDWQMHETEDQQLSSQVHSIQDPRKAIQALYNCVFPSDTPRTAVSSARTRLEDLHRILIQYLLRRAAKEYDCSALLFGDSGTRMSIRLIESLAKGAGHKLPVEGSEACWVDDVLLVRPLKGHSAQEIRYFAQAKDLEYLQGQELVPSTVQVEEAVNGSTGGVNGQSGATIMDKSSIARLTETFILNLEKGVPSTVSTIGRTGSKLVLNAAGGNGEADPSAQGAGFDVVGPTISLPSRKERRRMSEASSASASALSNLSLNEPRIGARAMRLAQNSSQCFRWSTSHGCAFCSMPCQKQARFWKRNITISSLDHVAPEAILPTDEDRAGKWLNLADHLCYSCLLVLIPSSTHPSLLPPYVLDNLRSTTDPTSNDDASLETLQNASQPHQHPQFVEHKLDRSEMKAEINEFLIN